MHREVSAVKTKNLAFIANLKAGLSSEINFFTVFSNHIIPFFDKYNIRGSKNSDFLHFKSAALIIKNKEYLNKEGMNKVLQLKNKFIGLNNKTKNNHGDD